MKNFFKKYVTVYHIVCVVFLVVFAVIYWYLKGQFSDYILKNNVFLLSGWAIVVGYITGDFLHHARKRSKDS